MDEEIEATEAASVGERLREAREAKGLSLEDIAAETRVPLRHLESLEAADWERLPAPTYTVGFAKSYAGAVGLDRAEIGDQLKFEMGGITSTSSALEHFEPADPARTMPKWLVVSAIAAIVVAVLVFTWVRNQSLSEEVPAPAAAPSQPPVQQQTQAQAAQPVQPTSAQGPVVLTALGPAWVRITDQGSTLYEGMMQPGQTYQVPSTAAAPTLRAGAPEALRITVGQSIAPPVGPAGVVVDHVSLRPADLMRGPASAPSTTSAAPPQNSLAQ